MNRFEKKIHDLKLSKNVAIQTAPQIRLIQSNDKMPADKIQMAALSTVPLWESQIKIALGLHRQEGRAARQSAEADLLRIERQLKKYKNKLVSKQQNAASFRKEFIEKEVSTDDEIQIIRTKRFGMKPMYPEDACVQMELLGHNFFVFRNAETEEVNVVYKRKGNTYGLIEPEF